MSSSIFKAIGDGLVKPYEAVPAFKDDVCRQTGKNILNDFFKLEIDHTPKGKAIGLVFKELTPTIHREIDASFAGNSCCSATANKVFGVAMLIIGILATLTGIGAAINVAALAFLATKVIMASTVAGGVFFAVIGGSLLAKGHNLDASSMWAHAIVNGMERTADFIMTEPNKSTDKLEEEIERRKAEAIKIEMSNRSDAPISLFADG